MCNKEVSITEKPGNFYIKVMNQTENNEYFGNKPIYVWFCSWEHLEDFIKQEN